MSRTGESNCVEEMARALAAAEHPRKRYAWSRGKFGLAAAGGHTKRARSAGRGMLPAPCKSMCPGQLSGGPLRR